MTSKPRIQRKIATEETINARNKDADKQTTHEQKSVERDHSMNQDWIILVRDKGY